MPTIGCDAVPVARLDPVRIVSVSPPLAVEPAAALYVGGGHDVLAVHRAVRQAVREGYGVHPRLPRGRA
jgi:hypothetical protein